MKSLTHYCRSCCHVTYIKGIACAWCGSRATSLLCHCFPLKPEPRYSRPQNLQPTVQQQINYAIQFRLAKGFAILGGGEI
jgi:hypothetical protein